MQRIDPIEIEMTTMVITRMEVAGTVKFISETFL